MAVPSPNVLLALFIVSFSLSAIFHRTSQHHDTGSPPNVFSHFAADIFIPSTNDTFYSRPAAFGSEFPDHLPGRLVKAWGDGLACSDVGPEADSDDSPGIEYEGMIVLVQRGVCSFAEKVRRVQHAGGIAVVVGDNTPGYGLLTMYAKGDTKDIAIPSTFVSHATYLSLSFLLSLPPPLDIVISTSTESDWPLLDTLLLVILSPLFTLACIYFLLILRRRVQRRRELAPLSVVKSLPHRKWTREKDEDDAEQGTSGANGHGNATGSPEPDTHHSANTRVNISECVVCLEDFVEGDILITLPCNHEFHELCITPWLTTRRRLCPICKRDIITPPQTHYDTGDVNESSPLLRREDDWRGDTATSV